MPNTFDRPGEVGVPKMMPALGSTEGSARVTFSWAMFSAWLGGAAIAVGFAGFAAGLLMWSEVVGAVSVVALLFSLIAASLGVVAALIAFSKHEHRAAAVGLVVSLLGFVPACLAMLAAASFIGGMD